MSPPDEFAEYARCHLDTQAFLPDFGKPEERVFAASLASTRALLPQLDARMGHDPMRVVAGYLDTMVPSAFAGRDGALHYIGMHQALLVTIIDLALFAFTQATFMPTIGDAARDDSPLPRFGSVPGLFLLDRTLQGGAIDTATDRHRVPNDAARHASAIYFALLMARFVWLHEWAHCRLGHVNRLSAAGEACLVEVELVGWARTRNAGDVAERHRMELEADLAALRLCLTVSSSGWENVPGIAAFDDDTRTELILTGAYLMTWLFDAYDRHAATIMPPTHPSPADRRDALIRAARALSVDDTPSFAAINARAEVGFQALIQRMSEALTP